MVGSGEKMALSNISAGKVDAAGLQILGADLLDDERDADVSFSSSTDITKNCVYYGGVWCA